MMKRFLDVAPKSERVTNIPMRFWHSLGSRSLSYSNKGTYNGTSSASTYSTPNKYRLCD